MTSYTALLEEQIRSFFMSILRLGQKTSARLLVKSLPADLRRSVSLKL